MSQRYRAATNGASLLAFSVKKPYSLNSWSILCSVLSYSKAQDGIRMPAVLLSARKTRNMLCCWPMAGVSERPFSIYTDWLNHFLKDLMNSRWSSAAGFFCSNPFQDTIMNAGLLGCVQKPRCRCACLLFSALFKHAQNIPLDRL